MIRLSLRARFLFVLVALMVVIFLAITSLIVRQNTKTLRANLIAESKSFASLATQPVGNAFVIYRNSGTIRIGQEITSFTDSDQAINQVEVIDTNGNVLFANSPDNKITVRSDNAVSVTPTYLYNKDGSLSAIVEPYLETFGIHHYDIVYGISYQSVNQSINDIVSLIVKLSAGILLVAIVVCYALINRLFIRPVEEVSRIARLISQGDLDRQIHLDRRDEIGDLASAVDTMANSLKSDIAKLRNIDQLKSEFLMITSHSLRTPVTIISGYIDNIRSSKDPNKNLMEHIDEISSNITRLGNFAEDALTISNMEEGQSALRKEVVEVAPILERAADEFLALTKQKNIHFVTKIDTSDKVNLSKPYIHSALWNLLDNAYKFTPENGTIELKAHHSGKDVEISVKDTGIGIAANEVPKLFTKFHRATTTLEYNYEGMGIGLYLTKLVVEQHGGKVSVDTEEGKGSTFTMRLPIDQPSEHHDAPSK